MVCSICIIDVENLKDTKKQRKQKNVDKIHNRLLSGNEGKQSVSKPSSLKTQTDKWWISYKT